MFVLSCSLISFQTMKNHERTLSNTRMMPWQPSRKRSTATLPIGSQAGTSRGNRAGSVPARQARAIQASVDSLGSLAGITYGGSTELHDVLASLAPDNEPSVEISSAALEAINPKQKHSFG